MLAEFRLDGELKMVSLIDRLADGLSAVYTFTIRTTPSPAWVFNVLWQAELTQQLACPISIWATGYANARKCPTRRCTSPCRP